MSAILNAFIGQASSSSSSYDSDAQAYFDAITTNSGTISNGSKDAINTFVLALKSASLWTKMIDVGVFAGDQLAAALVKLKAASGTSDVITNVGFVSGDYTEATGLLGNGTTSKYLRLGVNATHLTQNDTSMSCYNRSSSAAVSGWGVDNPASTNIARFAFHDPWSDGNLYAYEYKVNVAGGQITGVSPGGTPYGHLLHTRTSSTDFRVFRNGSQVGSTNSTSVAGSLSDLGSSEMYLFNWNSIGTGAISGVASSYRYAFYHVGTGLTPTNVSDLYTALQALQTSLGRNV